MKYNMSDIRNIQALCRATTDVPAIIRKQIPTHERDLSERGAFNNACLGTRVYHFSGCHMSCSRYITMRRLTLTFFKAAVDFIALSTRR